MRLFNHPHFPKSPLSPSLRRSGEKGKVENRLFLEVRAAFLFERTSGNFFFQGDKTAFRVKRNEKRPESPPMYPWGNRYLGCGNCPIHKPRKLSTYFMLIISVRSAIDIHFLATVDKVMSELRTTSTSQSSLLEEHFAIDVPS